MNKMKNKNSFFFFIDYLNEMENNNFYLKVDNYFKNNPLICNNKIFSVFSNDKINFDFINKNFNLLSFFYFDNKFFFKNHLKILKAYSLNNKIRKIKIINSIFLNFFFFFRHIFTFSFILKSFIRFKKV